MPTSTDRSDYPPLPPTQTGMRGKCPRCGVGALFNGFLATRESCSHCGLDYDFADPADGPAFFIICFACVPVVAFSVWMEVALGAPYWLNALLTLPLLIAFCIVPLRPLKGWLIAQQYNHSAREGTIADQSNPLGGAEH